MAMWGLTRAVAAACSLLGVSAAAGAAAELANVGDEVVLLQQRPKSVLDNFVPEPGAKERFLQLYNSTKSRGTLEALGDIVEAFYGDSKEGPNYRVKGMENLTKQEYAALMSSPWIDQAMHTLRLGSPERIYEMAMSLHVLLRKTGDSWANMLQNLRVEEKQEAEAWKDRFTSTAAPSGAVEAAPTAAKPARRGPSLQDLFKGADDLVAGVENRAPVLGNLFQHSAIPLSQFASFGPATDASRMHSAAPAANAAATPGMMAPAPQASVQGNWFYGPAAQQPPAAAQWQQWQQPQQPAPGSWGPYPQQPYQAQQPMPYAQFMQPVQPMAAGAWPPQGPQAFPYGQPMPGMQGWAAPPAAR